MSCLFNSYDPYFKQPFGAVRAGQTVHLTLCIPEELGYVDPHLRSEEHTSELQSR